MYNRKIARRVINAIAVVVDIIVCMDQFRCARVSRSYLGTEPHCQSL